MSTLNGTTTPRKSLSSQLDRFDLILDGLSEGLNEAVRDAVKDAVGEAVRVSVRETLQAFVKELLTHPDLLPSLHTLLNAAQPTEQSTNINPPEHPETQQPTLRRRWGARFWAWLSPILVSKLESVKGMASQGCNYLKVLWQHRWSALSLTGIALGVGTGSYFLSPLLSAILAGLGGASLTVLILLGFALLRVCNVAKDLNLPS